MTIPSTIPFPNSPAIDLRTGYPTREWYLYWSQPVVSASGISGVVTVSQGGTGLTGGNSGGILGFTDSVTLVSSDTLGKGKIVFGGGPGKTPSTPLGTGTSRQFLNGNENGYPTWATFVAGQNINIEYVNGQVRFSANLGTASITGIDSVVITGSLGASNAQVSLVNDSLTPGDLEVYGTNVSGVRGWQLLYTMLKSILFATSPVTLTEDDTAHTITIGDDGSASYIPLVTGGLVSDQPQFVHFADGSLVTVRYT